MSWISRWSPVARTGLRMLDAAVGLSIVSAGLVGLFNLTTGTRLPFPMDPLSTGTWLIGLIILGGLVARGAAFARPILLGCAVPFALGAFGHGRPAVACIALIICGAYSARVLFEVGTWVERLTCCVVAISAMVLTAAVESVAAHYQPLFPAIACGFALAAIGLLSSPRVGGFVCAGLACISLRLCPRYPGDALHELSWAYLTVVPPLIVLVARLLWRRRHERVRGS